MIALSTAFKKALIGISIDDKRLCYEIDANCKHSENIMISIDNMLNKMNKSISQNEGYAVVIGPGSFTGLRIGLALIKGLLAGEKEQNVIPITSFELMAYTYIKNFSPKENFYCIIDALSDLAFVCHFDKNGDVLAEGKLLTKEEVSLLEGIKIGLKEENMEVADFLIEPSSEDLLEFALMLKQNKKEKNIKIIEPVYLRKSQAEVSLENNQKKD